MKIAYDAKRAAQNRTGLGNYSRFVIEGVSKLHDENEYLLYVPNPRKTQLLNSLKQNPSCSIHYPEGLVWKKLPSLWRVWGITNQIGKDHPDIYHGLSNELPYGIERIKEMKTIVTIHDLIFLRYPEFYPFIDRHIYTRKFHSACKRADSIIAVSECTKRDIVHYFNIEAEKIKVLYQGCDESFRHAAPSGLKEEAKTTYNLPKEYLLYVGSIESRKNLIRIVEALAETSCQLPLVAVGKRTPYAEKVQQRADELGVSNRLMMIHEVKFLHLPAIYQMASLFIYPSYFEGFGIPLLEALCSRIPVIGATGSCLEEAGGPDSIYVDPDNAHELALSIDQVMNEDSSLRSNMIQHGLQYSERFQPDYLAKELMQHYQSILRK